MYYLLTHKESQLSEIWEKKDGKHTMVMYQDQYRIWHQLTKTIPIAQDPSLVPGWDFLPLTEDYYLPFCLNRSNMGI